MANSNLSETKPSITPESPKKKYSPPKLTEYGTIKEITNLVGNKQASDNPQSGTKTGIV